MTRSRPVPGCVANPIPSKPPTGTPYRYSKTGRQGLGAATIGAARSWSRSDRWWAVSSGSRTGCSTGATFFVPFVMGP